VRKNFSHKEKPRKIFSLREKTVKNGEEFSHMGRSGEKWEKIRRKKKIACPANCYCQSQMMQSCKQMYTLFV